MGNLFTTGPRNFFEWLNKKYDDIVYARKHQIESCLAMHGHVFTEHWRDGKLIHACDQGKNTFTTEGMNWILDECFNAAAAATGDMYCGIFKNNVTPALADTAATKLGAAGTYGECQDADYDSPATNRDAYSVAAASSSSVTNTADKAAFTIAASITVYGAFLVTDAAKTSTSGKLLCAKAFTTSRAVVDNDVLNVLYVLTMSTS